MRQSVRFIVVPFLLLAASVCQTSGPATQSKAPARKSPTADYVGVWTATFQGHPSLTIKLVPEGAELSGAVQHPRTVEFDNDGGLKSMSDEQVNQVIQSTAVQGDGLLIVGKDNSTQGTERFVMRLTGPDTADVKMVGMAMPPGMPKPKPWKVTRTADSK